MKIIKSGVIDSLGLGILMVDEVYRRQCKYNLKRNAFVPFYVSRIIPSDLLES